MSQMNHNYSHVFETDGLTPWEKLRIMREFLRDRKKALEMARVDDEEIKERLALFSQRLTTLRLNTNRTMQEHDEGIALTSRIRKLEIGREERIELVEDCKKEIEFLENFIEKLVEICEPTRIPGKTDKEMYEINYPLEVRMRLKEQAYCEYLSNGRLGTETIKALGRDPSILEELDPSIEWLDREVFDKGFKGKKSLDLPSLGKDFKLIESAKVE